MIENLLDFPNDLLLHADVTIVGTGPAGIALAIELSKSNLRIVVLESGDAEHGQESQELNDAELLGIPFIGHLSGRSRGLGGTSRTWAGQCLPLDEIDFEKRPWVNDSGWPIPKGSLDTYIKKAEKFFDIENEVYNETNFGLFDSEAPKWSGDLLINMFTVYTSRPQVARFYRNQLQNCSNLRVLLHANVTEVLTDQEGSKVRGVSFTSRCSTHKGLVQSPVVVLCTGGLENARLLLLSRSVDASGLGNKHDLVGRYLQDHPNAITATLTDSSIIPPQDTFRLFYKNKRKYFPKFRLSEAIQRKEKVLNCNAHLVFELTGHDGLSSVKELFSSLRLRRLPKNLHKLVYYMIKDVFVIGSAVARRLRGLSPKVQTRSIHLQCYLEQAPNRDSRVTLHPTRTDALGLPKLQIDWRLTDQEIRTLRVMTSVAASELIRLNYGEFRSLDWVSQPNDEWQSYLKDSYHHAGTTRMGASPEDGVVDVNGMVFDVEGLYCCGSSIFPTSGYANPTLTIVALAFRLADHIVEKAGASNF